MGNESLSHEIEQLKEDNEDLKQELDLAVA